MFDIAFAELLIVSVLALVILGPQRLPVVMRTMGLWLGRMRRIYTNVRQEIDREVGMDDIRRQLHNEQITQELKQVEAEARSIKSDLTSSVNQAIKEGEKEIDSLNETNPAKENDDSNPSA